MISKIRKRDGREVPFNIEKISNAIFKAAQAVGGQDYETSLRLARQVSQRLEARKFLNIPTVEDIQDSVEKVLIEEGHAKTAKEYILYRAERSKVREANTRLMKIFEDITFNNGQPASLEETAMGTMYKYATESARKFYDLSVLNPDHAKAHRLGQIHIDKLEFLTLTTNSCQIDLDRIYKEEFKEREGQSKSLVDIDSYIDLAIIAIQSNQNDQHGFQSLANFDYLMAKGVDRTYRNEYRKNLKKAVELLTDNLGLEENIDNIFLTLEKDHNLLPKLSLCRDYMAGEKAYLKELIMDEELVDRIQKISCNYAKKETDLRTYRAMEKLIYGLNRIYSRVGGKLAYSSLAYGTDTSAEGRMVIDNIMKASYRELPDGQEPIYPLQIFKLKDGINLKESDPNYDMLEKSYQLLKKRSQPSYAFIDAKFNQDYYKKADPKTEVAYTGFDIRILENLYDKSKSSVIGRGNLSTTVINLPRLALESQGELNSFFKLLEIRVNLIIAQLLERFEIQASKNMANYPHLMGKKIWMDSERLEEDESLRQVLKHGSLSLGYIGLAQALIVLNGSHHGKNLESQELGLRIVGYLRARMDDIASQYQMNFNLSAYGNKQVGQRLIRLDREEFGEIEFVTDRSSYSPGFSIPEEDKIDALSRIKLESKYHALSNGGHRSKIILEDDGDSIHKFKLLINTMMEEDVGYASIDIH